MPSASPTRPPSPASSAPISGSIPHKFARSDKHKIDSRLYAIPMPRTISMLMLGVASLEASVPFYRDIVELEIENQIPGMAFLNAGPIKLLLSEDLGRAITPASGAVEVIL